MATKCENFPEVDINNMGEDAIDLDGYYKNIDQVRAENDRFVTVMKYDNSPDDEDSGDNLAIPVNSCLEVEMCALIRLFKDVFEAQGASKPNIRAVKIHFGFDTDTVIFLFQPIFLTDPDYVNRTGKHRYAVTKEGGYYQYDSDTNVKEFKKVTAEFAAGLKAEYARKMCIVHRVSSDYPEPLILNGNSWKRDTLAVIFSFKEIFDLYHTHHPWEDEISKYSSSLYFYNGVSPYSHRKFGLFKRNKHTIFISIEELQRLTGDDKDFAIGKAANMAHLCPPSCNPRFRVIKFGTNGNPPEARSATASNP